MQITGKQLDELRLGAITAIDGLWFLELERLYGFEKALEVDLEVWKRYGLVMMKRAARAAGIRLDTGSAIDMNTLNFLLGILCAVDGTDASGAVMDDNTLMFKVFSCSWWDNLVKAGREKVIPCEKIDTTIFGHWIEHLDPSLRMEFRRSRPRGDDCCEWIIRRGE